MLDPNQLQMTVNETVINHTTIDLNKLNEYHLKSLNQSEDQHKHTEKEDTEHIDMDGHIEIEGSNEKIPEPIYKIMDCPPPPKKNKKIKIPFFAIEPDGNLKKLFFYFNKLSNMPRLSLNSIYYINTSIERLYYPPENAFYSSNLPISIAILVNLDSLVFITMPISKYLYKELDIQFKDYSLPKLIILYLQEGLGKLFGNLLFKTFLFTILFIFLYLLTKINPILVYWFTIIAIFVFFSIVFMGIFLVVYDYLKK